MTLYYAGIGSRETPTDILVMMEEIAIYLDKKEYVLRSGGAIGADTAFKKGSRHSEIFTANDCTPAAEALSSRFHPAWKLCTPYIRKLHGRNAMILLGQDLNTPVRFVVCYTPDGLASGGTGQALRIAQDRKIQIFNLYYPEIRARLTNGIFSKITSETARTTLTKQFVVHCKKNRYDIYIGRPSKWGNPFGIDKDTTREEVILMYKEWLLAQPELVQQCKTELKGKILGCYCAPAKCHGDVLVTIANS